MGNLRHRVVAFVIVILVAPLSGSASDIESGQGSIQRDFGFMKVDVPSGWFVHLEEGSGIKAAFVTKQNIAVEKRFTTGLSVNAIRDIPQKRSKKPSEYALEVITQLTKLHEHRAIEQLSAVPFRSASTFLRSKGPDGVVTVQYSAATGNDQTGTVFFVVFESLEREWDESWKIGRVLLQTLHLTPDY